MHEPLPEDRLKRREDGAVVEPSPDRGCAGAESARRAEATSDVSAAPQSGTTSAEETTLPAVPTTIAAEPPRPFQFRLATMFWILTGAAVCCSLMSGVGAAGAAFFAFLSPAAIYLIWAARRSRNEERPLTAGQAASLFLKCLGVTALALLAFVATVLFGALLIRASAMLWPTWVEDLMGVLIIVVATILGCAIGSVSYIIEKLWPQP